MSPCRGHLGLRGFQTQSSWQASSFYRPYVRGILESSSSPVHPNECRAYGRKPRCAPLRANHHSLSQGQHIKPKRHHCVFSHLCGQDSEWMSRRERASAYRYPIPLSMFSNGESCSSNEAADRPSLLRTADLHSSNRAKPTVSDDC